MQFTRGDRWGFLSFGILILLLISYRTISSVPDASAVIELDSSQIKFILIADEKQGGNNDKPVEIVQSYSKKPLFNFDPNTLDSSGYVRLGFSSKQTHSILSYRANYGPFRTAEDFAKIYVVSEEKYKELSPYIRIGEIASSKILSINSAEIKDLIHLKGIGEKRAGRIIKYRNKLGGFVDESQYSEIYGFTDDLIDELKKNCVIDKDEISKINVNQASKDELLIHPYVDFEIAATILKFRDGKMIKSHQELQELLGDKYLRLQHYLTTE